MKVWSRDSSSSQCVHTGLRVSVLGMAEPVRGSQERRPAAKRSHRDPCTSRDLQNLMCCSNLGMTS
jgi:hypothetical protein